MTRIVVVGLAIVAVGGLFAAKSFVFAGETARLEPAQTAKTQAELDDEVAWEAYRDDFAALLDEDRDYAAAEESVLDVPLGDEYDEAYEEAVGARDARYRELERAVYEQHFGMWTGTDAEFGDLIASKANDNVGNIEACSRAAVTVCGRGKVKSITVGADGSCSFVCGTPTTGDVG